MLISCLSDMKVLFYMKIYEIQPIKLYILQNVIESNYFSIYTASISHIIIHKT